MEENNDLPLVSNARMARGRLEEHSYVASQLEVQLSDVSESETLSHQDVMDDGVTNHRVNGT